MRKSLKQLINDEHFAIQELEAKGDLVVFYANQITEYQKELDNLLAEKDEHTDKFIADETHRLSVWIDDTRKEQWQAMDERDIAVSELATIRGQLKQYLLDIINGN